MTIQFEVAWYEKRDNQWTRVTETYPNVLIAAQEFKQRQRPAAIYLIDERGDKEIIHCQTVDFT